MGKLKPPKTPPPGDSPAPKADELERAGVRLGIPPTESGRRRILQLILTDDRNSSMPPPAAPDAGVAEPVPAEPGAAGSEPPSAPAEVEVTGSLTPAEPDPPEEAEAYEHDPATIRFGPLEAAALRSLSRWLSLTGLLALALGALTGLSYPLGEGQVAHVVVGILSSALALWLLTAASQIYRAGRRDDRVNVASRLDAGMVLLRSALMLKAVLLFSALALGCFVFSLAVSILFLL